MGAPRAPRRRSRRSCKCSAWSGLTRPQTVFPERSGIESRMRKLPNLRGRHICVVRLTAGAGRIQHTGPGSHHTWWPLADFDILPQCAVEEDP
jgi:hypothetical protein